MVRILRFRKFERRFYVKQLKCDEGSFEADAKRTLQLRFAEYDARMESNHTEAARSVARFMRSDVTPEVHQRASLILKRKVAEKDCRHRKRAQDEKVVAKNNA